MNAIDAQCACGRGVGQVAQEPSAGREAAAHRDSSNSGVANFITIIGFVAARSGVHALSGRSATYREKKRTDLMVGASYFTGWPPNSALRKYLSGLRKSAGAGSQHYAGGVLYRGTTMASAIAEAGLWILILSAALFNRAGPVRHRL